MFAALLSVSDFVAGTIFAKNLFVLEQLLGKLFPQTFQFVCSSMLIQLPFKIRGLKLPQTKILLAKIESAGLGSFKGVLFVEKIQKKGIANFLENMHCPTAESMLNAWCLKKSLPIDIQPNKKKVQMRAMQNVFAFPHQMNQTDDDKSNSSNSSISIPNKARLTKTKKAIVNWTFHYILRIFDISAIVVYEFFLLQSAKTSIYTRPIDRFRRVQCECAWVPCKMYI